MKTKLLWGMLLVCAYGLSQTAGQVDSSFGNNGAALSLTGENVYPRAVDFENYTGKTFVGGKGGSGAALLACFNFYGLPETNFNGTGILLITDLGIDQQIYDVDSSNPGTSEVLACGYFEDALGGTYGFIRKYSADGSLNTGFGTGGTIITGGAVVQIKALSDGSCVALTYQSGGRTLEKYSAAGIADTSFGTGGSLLVTPNTSYQPYWMTLQTDQNIVISGSYYDGTNTYPLVGKVLANGTMDTSFGTGGYFIYPIVGAATHAVTQSSGKIVLGTIGAGNAYSLSRLTATGAIDLTYGENGYRSYPLTDFSYMDEIGVQADDNIVIAGGQGDNGFNVAMATPDGAESLAFNTQTFIPGSPYDEAWCLDIMPHSYAVAAGTTSSADFSEFTLLLRRVFTKAPVVSMIGNNYGAGDFTTDLNMTTTDGINYTLNDIALTAGEVKFRVDHDWGINFGAAAVNPFPSGTATMGLGNIFVPTASVYDVTFNMATGVYTFVDTLGIESFNSNQVSVYPNPSNDRINIGVRDQMQIDGIRIVDLSGKIVMENTGDATNISIATLATGTYIMKIFSNGSEFQQRIVKK